MDASTEEKSCKYCGDYMLMSRDEGIECSVCKLYIHVRCLKRGSVPGGLYGDTFFTLKCEDCSPDQTEEFERIKLPWLQVIVLSLYHLQHKSPGLARKGFFHWRHHVATFIDKNWDVLYPSDFKKKKKWTGTIAGILSHFNKFIFLSGISVFNEPAFWTLLYPKITPLTISTVYSMVATEKQNIKLKKGTPVADSELFSKILQSFVKDSELLQTFATNNIVETPEEFPKEIQIKSKEQIKRKKTKQRGSHPKRSLTMAQSSSVLSDSFNSLDIIEQRIPTEVKKIGDTKPKEIKLLDPMFHYNTSLKNYCQTKGVTLQAKLTGGIRTELILSPYSGIYLKPYIYRDVESFPHWLKLMAEIQLAGNAKNDKYVLPPRSCIDYTYVQPEHIPAVNSLCNQFFWPGIDMTDTLKYPDFSCIALYKRLIVGFAFLVPNISHTEHYMSFMFTRPHWRNCGIGKFMLYHLIQTGMGKDITLHVSMNNPAMLLYQKFGFKTENVVIGFYDKYLRSGVNESKNAFYCRLER